MGIATACIVVGFAFAWLLYANAGHCGWNGRFCVDGLASRLEASLQSHLVGQEFAVAQLSALINDHLSEEQPRKPLVVSLHGPPGVGKSYFHRLLAAALYNVSGAADCEPGALNCAGYRVLFGLDHLAAEQGEQASLLRASVRSQLQRHPESLLVIEEYDKADCGSRGILRQLADTASRTIIVLEANTGSAHLFKLLESVGSRKALSPEAAQKALKDVVFHAWSNQRCEEPVDTQKLLSLVDLFVPFLPLERRHVHRIISGLLVQRRAAGMLSLEFGELCVPTSFAYRLG